jgi:hypothetical protein
MTFVRRGFLSRRTMICATIGFVEAARSAAATTPEFMGAPDRTGMRTRLY